MYLTRQRQYIKTQLDTAISRVLTHGQYIMGPEVAELERQLELYTGAPFAITCANGTDALILLLMAKGVKPGDAVFVPAFSFAATCEAVAILGASPVFVDINPDTFHLCLDSLLLAINKTTQLGLNPKGIITVDLFGLPFPNTNTQFNHIIQTHDLFHISDAAQSFGGYIKNQSSHQNNGQKNHDKKYLKVGNLAEMTATSFFPSKPLGCYGDGGCVFTNNPDIAEQVKSLRLHGQGEHKYQNTRIGVNSRLDTLQAAILLEKLKIFDEELEKRTAIANYYYSHLQSLNTPQVNPLFHLKLPSPITTLNHHTLHPAWGYYTLQCSNKKQRDGLQDYLKTCSISTMIYYPTPLHLQPAYLHYPRANTQLPISEQATNCVLSLPMHPYLAEQELAHIVNAIHQHAALNSKNL